jgi:hypothetical protein
MYEQNNGNTKKLRNTNFVLATLKEFQLATLNIPLPFIYIPQCLGQCISDGVE